MTWSDSPCVECQGYIGNEGYGVRFEGRRSILAHREAWEHEHGPIPNGLCVLHHCDNRRCINVAHLFLGTRRDNARDREAKRRGTYGERNGQARLRQSQVEAIRRELAAGGNQYAIAAKFGISQQHVSDIKRRKRWASVS